VSAGRWSWEGAEGRAKSTVRLGIVPGLEDPLMVKEMGGREVAGKGEGGGWIVTAVRHGG